MVTLDAFRRGALLVTTGTGILVVASLAIAAFYLNLWYRGNGEKAAKEYKQAGQNPAASSKTTA